MNSFVYDDEFLLRCAATYNWDMLIDRCLLILQLFGSGGSHDDWDNKNNDEDCCYNHSNLFSGFDDQHRRRCCRRLEAAKRQLIAKDQWGNTVLHAVCYNKPPLRVVTLLLEAAAMANMQLHARFSLDHSSPLLIACATGADTQVIRALLDPPTAINNDSDYMDPGSLVWIADRQGNTPLSELTVQYELQRKSRQYTDTAPPLEQVAISHIIQSSTTTTTSPLLQSFWAKLECLLAAAWKAAGMMAPATANQVASTTTAPTLLFPSMLHAAAYLADACPPVLFSLLCRCLHHMTSVRHDGALPVHFAIRGGASRAIIPSRQARERRNFAVISLLDLYPQAAALSDEQRRTPFCKAIVSGFHWHGRCNCCRHAVEGPLQKLWRCEPRALVSRDVMTGLYPCFLAAATTTTTMMMVQEEEENHANNNNDDDEDEDIDTMHLDTIFCLLQRFPQVIEETTRNN